MVNTIGSGFSNPFGVAVDGNVFVADTLNNTVKEIVAATQKLPTTAVASTSASLSIPFTFDTSGSIGAPMVLTQGAAGLDFADAGTGSCNTNGTSYSYNPGDTCTVDVTFTPKYPGQRLGAVELRTTAGATIATAHIYGTGTGPLVTFPSNTTVKTIASGFSDLLNMAVDASGNVFVVDYLGNAVKEIVAVGGVISPSSTVVTIGSGFSGPQGVAVDGSGNVFVVDSSNDSVKEIIAVGAVVSSSSIVNTISNSISQPSSVAVDGSGNLFVTAGNALQEIVAVGGVVSSSSAVNTISNSFSFLTDVAVDGNGNVFVADSSNNAVKEIMAVNGVVSSTSTINPIGSGFVDPFSVAVDASGNVFVADDNGRAVKEIVAVNGVVSSSSTVNTLGSGFKLPVGVAVDGRGNVFVADQSYGAVKEIALSDPPSVSFATATHVGTTDATDGPQTVTVANSGNAALTFTVPTSGNNPSISTNFTLDSASSGSCPLTTSRLGTLVAGASCTLPIRFAPTAGGTISGSLVLTDTNLNATPSTTQTVSLSATGQLTTPSLVFATIPNHTNGDAPFIVTATSASSGAVTYAVSSGPATISGSTVTLTGAGTVVLSASQAATEAYAAATASTSFTVAAAVPTGFSMGGTATQSQSVTASGAATFSLSLAPTSGSYPGAVTFAATGLPTGATATFSPSTIAANGGAQTVTLTIQTSGVASLIQPLSQPGGYIAVAFLFLPLFGTGRMRRVAQKMGRGTSIALLLLLSFGAVAGLSGCGGGSKPAAQPQSYTITVTATSGSVQHSSNFTLLVQ